MLASLSLTVALALAPQDPKAPVDAPTVERVAYIDINDVPPAIREPTGDEYALIERLVVQAETARDAEQFDEAVERATELAALSAATFGPRHPITASCRNIIGQVKYDRGDMEGAEAIFREGLEIRRAALGQVHPDVAESLNNIAGVLSRRGLYAEALPLLQQAVDIWAQVGTFDRNLADGLANLATQYAYLGRYVEAEAPARRAVALTEKVYDPDDAETAGNYGVLGDILVALGQYDQAEDYLVRADRAFAGSNASHTLKAGLTLFRLGTLRSLRGRHLEAADLYRRSIEVFVSAVGPDHANTGAALAQTGLALYRDGQFERAEPLLRRGLKVQERNQGQRHPDAAATRIILAQLLLVQGQGEQADALVRRSVGDLDAVLGANSQQAASARVVYASVLLADEKPGQAEAQSRMALAVLQSVLSADHPIINDARSTLAEALRKEGRVEDAEQILDEGLAQAIPTFGAGHEDVMGLRAQLMQTMLDRSQFERALATGRLSPPDPTLSRAAMQRARALLRLKVQAGWLAANRS